MEAIYLACGAGGPQLKRNPLDSHDHQHPYMYEYSFRWTPPEYVRACHAITWHMRGVVPTFPILFAAALFLFVTTPFATGNPAGPWIVFSIGTVFFLWGGYLYWGAPWLTARRVLREDPCAKEDVRHVVTAEAFCVRTGAVAVDVKWAHMTQIVETPEFLLFYFSKRAAYFTPKRVIPEADLENLRASLRQVVGDRARLS